MSAPTGPTARLPSFPSTPHHQQYRYLCFRLAKECLWEHKNPAVMKHVNKKRWVDGKSKQWREARCSLNKKAQVSWFIAWRAWGRSSPNLALVHATAHCHPHTEEPNFTLSQSLQRKTLCLSHHTPIGPNKPHSKNRVRPLGIGWMERNNSPNLANTEIVHCLQCDLILK